MPPQAKPNGPTLQEKAVMGVEAISQIVGERDRLISEAERLRADLAMATEKAAQLAGRLATVQAERDHYMRFSTEIVTNLNNINIIIGESVKNAKLAAFKPPPVATPAANVVDLADTASLENLLARLPANGARHEDN